MTDRHENLRTALTEIAQRVDSVDLYDRAFARSSQIGRRRAAATVFAAAAAVVLISAGAWQILPRTSSAPQPPASPGLPSPTGLATPTPTSTPAADPTRGLGKATLRFPAWPRVGDLGQCSTGPVALVEGTHADNTKGVQIHLASATLTQLDGAPMYIAVVACSGPSEGQVQQAVAYRKTSAGAFTVLARVLATDEEIHTIGEISPEGDDLKIQVGQQTVAGSAPPEYSHLNQWRTFRWNGARFAQTGGPTTFFADTSVADVSATASRLVFQPADAGCRIGTMTLTVTNNGPQAASDVSAAVMLPAVAEPDEQCQIPPDQGYQSVLARVGTLAPGESRAVTVTVIAGEPIDTPLVLDQPYYIAELRTGDQRYPKTAHFVIEWR